MRRLPVPSERDFRSRLHDPAVASRVGVWLGICFGLAFVTGVWSHYAQAHVWWLPYPTRPVWLYRVTQGVHVLSGTAAVPLLLVKLWTVYPKLFQPVPWRSARAMVVHGLERASIGVLVAASLFQLATGLANSAKWYPWPFLFRPSHYAVAWVAIGALVVHIAVKLPAIRSALGSPLDGDLTGPDEPVADEAVAGPETQGRGLSRRGLLTTTWLATGAVVLGSAGITVPALRRVSVFGVRSGNGPQGVPVNRSASQAGVVASALSADYVLTVRHGSRTVTLTPADLEAMPQVTADLPIACVEGWSASATWTGVPIRDLLALVDAPEDADVKVVSLQTRYAFGRSTLPASFARDPLALLALRLDGERLSIDHGYPCRLIAPNHPGVLQTKWVSHLEVLPA